MLIHTICRNKHDYFETILLLFEYKLISVRKLHYNTHNIFYLEILDFPHGS